MKEKLSEWYRLAEAGDATSQYNLGHFYLVVKPADDHHDLRAVSYTHLTLPTIYSV